MRKILIISIVLSLILAFNATNVVSQEEPLNHRIISFMPDFYDFWEKAKDEPPEKKIELWNTVFESKHEEFYRQAVYGRLSGDQMERLKSRLLKGFLSSLTESDIKRMKEKENEIKKLIPETQTDLKRMFPDEERIISHYIIPSLNTSSGCGRIYENDMIIYYGLESLSTFKKPIDIKAIIAHETFHVIHFRKIAPAFMKKYGGDFNMHTIMQRMGALFYAFLEGMAVYTTEKIYPDAFRPGLIEKNVTEYEENFITYTKEFLKDNENFNYQKFRKYFQDPSGDKTIPEKFGYWIGYKVVEKLANNHTIPEMMIWDFEKVNGIVLHEMKKIVEK